MSSMSRKLLSAFALVLGTAAFAQPCTPNSLYEDSVFGVWPDTTENFLDGVVGLFYSDTLNLIVPDSAQKIDPTYPEVAIDSVALTTVAGLPPGLSIACASQTSAPCTYLPTILGCGLITGTPTAAGTYPLTLTVTGYFTTFIGVIPYPITFEGYEIVIHENTGIASLAPVGLTGVRSVPNPFTGRTTVEFNLARGGQVKLRVFNLLGDEVYAMQTLGKAGTNRIPFEASELEEGIYLYKVEGGSEAYTGRMMVNR